MPRILTRLRRICLQARTTALHCGLLCLWAIRLGIAHAAALLASLKSPAVVTTEKLPLLYPAHTQGCKSVHQTKAFKLYM